MSSAFTRAATEERKRSGGESWFGALGMPGETTFGEEDSPDMASDASLQGRWFDNDQGPADSRFVSRGPCRGQHGERTRLQKIAPRWHHDGVPPGKGGHTMPLIALARNDVS